MPKFEPCTGQLIQKKRKKERRGQFPSTRERVRLGEKITKRIGNAQPGWFEAVVEYRLVSIMTAAGAGLTNGNKKWFWQPVEYAEPFYMSPSYIRSNYELAKD